MANVSDYAKWVKVGVDLGYSGEELKQFVKDRQAEVLADKIAERQEKDKLLEMQQAEKLAERERQREQKLLEMQQAEKLALMEIEAKRQSELLVLETQKLEAAKLSEQISAQQRADDQEVLKFNQNLQAEENRRREEIEARLKSEELGLAAKTKSEELQAQIKIKELELASLQSGRAAERSTSREEFEHGSQREHGLGNQAKFLKMPIFHEHTDCLDAYLLRFERQCIAYKIPENQWALILVRSLEGKALETYMQMDATESENYNSLKETLLKRFQLTEKGYRNKFKLSDREPDETVSQYMTRLQRYLRQWLKMSGLDNDDDGLEALILKDQFFMRSSEDMRRFLKERGKLSLGDMIEQAQNFIESREYDHKKPETKHKDNKFVTKHVEFKKTDKNYSQFNKQQVNEQSQKNGWFKNNWKFQDHRKSDSSSGTKGPGCHRCGSTYHYISKCPEIDPAMQKHNPVSAVILDRERVIVEETIAVTSGIVNRSNEEDNGGYRESDLRNTRVNGREVKYLYDTGATSVLIKESLVCPIAYTGKQKSCILVDGNQRTFPTAMINIEGTDFKGETEALVVKGLIADLIVGPRLHSLPNSEVKKDCQNIETQTEWVEIITEGSCVDSDDVMSDWSSTSDEESENVSHVHKAAGCVTRSQKEVKPMIPKPLKCTKLPELNVTKAELILMQKRDVTLNKLWENASGVHEDESEIPKGKSLCVVKNGLLYRKFKEVLKEEIIYQLVIPSELREKVMIIAHESLLSAHQGIAKSLARINHEFYWPGLQSDVKRFVKSCRLCQLSATKCGISRAPLGHLPLVGIPFSFISVDLAGPVEPRSSHGNRYILCIVDMATRFADAVALKGISAEEVADALFSFYCRVGIPSKIHTDRGSQFTSELMRDVNKILHIKHSMSSPYHAMGNGAVERLNGTLKATLKKLMFEQPKEWDRFLNPLLFALRDSVHEGHGFTPFELVYGRSARGPMTILKELWTKETATEEVRDTYGYMFDLQNRIEETCKIAQEELAKNQTKSEKYYNKKSRLRKLEINDKVLLLLPVKANKMAFSWAGPYDVKDKVGDFDYRIEVAPGKIKTYHINMLKKFYTRDANEKKQENVTVASVVTVVNDGDSEQEVELLELYNCKQKETFENVILNPKLPKDIEIKCKTLVKKYKNIFSDVPGKTHLVKHEIRLNNDKPVKSKAYPTPYGLQREIDKEIESMLENGIIERSNSAYAAPLVVVRKADGSNRLCCNYKQLNKITVFDPEPMMSNDDIFVKLSEDKIFSKFDFCKGFWQIPMDPESEDLTSFTCKNGLFRFKVMPFGLVNSASSYNRMMRIMLEGVKNLESYIDDVLAHTKTWEEHFVALEEFFIRVRDAGLTMKPSKCYLGFTSIDFLGHTVGEGCIKPKAESVDKIKEMPRPKTKKQVRSFLGAVNFYRKFIPNCAAIMKPLTELTKKDSNLVVEWTKDLEEAFVKLKEILGKEPILKLPNVDREFIVQTDASNTAMGCVLVQEYEGIRHPVNFASKKFTDREKRYSVEERECLAMVWGIQKFHRYLYGKEFTIETDHCGLQYLKTGSVRNARVMRWYLAMQNFNFRVRYIKGCDNVIADYMSRGLND